MVYYVYVQWFRHAKLEVLTKARKMSFTRTQSDRLHEVIFVIRTNYESELREDNVFAAVIVFFRGGGAEGVSLMELNT